MDASYHQPPRISELPYIPNRVPTIEGVQHFDPVVVFHLLREGKCLLVDVRGEDRAAGLIEGAVHEPAIGGVPFLTRVPSLVQMWQAHHVVIFTCQYSAHRAPQCANWFREQAPPSQVVAILSGGFRGWEAAGLPVQSLALEATAAAAANAKAMELGNQFVYLASAPDASYSSVLSPKGQFVNVAAVYGGQPPPKPLTPCGTSRVWDKEKAAQQLSPTYPKAPYPTLLGSGAAVKSF